MKYLLLTTFTAAMLFGCSNPVQTPVESTPSEPSKPAVKQEQILHFTGPYDLTLTLKTKDNFATATMTDNSDRSFELKEAVSASGMKLANQDGVSIHIKNGEGVVELVPGKPINIKEFKSDKNQ